MRKGIKIFFLLLFIYLTLPAQEKFEWNKLDISIQYTPHFLKVNNSKDFRLIDATGTIFHYYNNHLTTIENPTTKKSTLVKGFFISPKKIYLIYTSDDWISHICLYNGKSWEEIFKSKLPLQNFSGDKTGLYVWGNYGVLIQIKEKEVVKIKTPYHSHVLRMVKEGKSDFIIFTKSDGIWEYKSKENKFILLTNDNFTFYANDVIRNKNILTDRKGNFFETDNDTLVICDITKTEYITTVQNDVGIRSYSFFDDNKKKHTVIFPDYLRIHSIKALPTGNLLIINKNNEIYFGKRTNKISFTNQAGLYGLKGGSSKITYQTAGCDLNNDNRLDITRFEYFINHNFEFLIKEGAGKFRSFPNTLAEKNNLSKQIIFRIFDYNSDGKKDLVTLTKEESTLHFKFFTLKRNNDFELKDEKTFLLKNSKVIHTNFIPVDFDADGDNDIMLIEYYGKKNETGEITILRNSMFGSKWNVDKSLSNLTRAWNVFAIFADFNNDDLNDIYIITKWRKNILLYNSEKGFSDVTETRLPTSDNNETRTGGCFDYDNDGDLDILIFTEQNHFELFENNGEGFFTHAGEKTKLSSLKINTQMEESASLSFGDLNNDGFTDFIFTVKYGIENKSYVILNSKGKRFYYGNDEINLNITNAQHVLTSDFDGDGDLDVYASYYGEDQLWVSNLNDNNFIEIILGGSKSNSDGIGAKIRIYDSRGKLIRYHQVGANEFQPEGQKSNIHFGVPEGKYKVEVSFYGGKKVTFDNINNGRIISVDEQPAEEAFMELFPAKVFATITDAEVIKYIGSMLTALLILLLAIYYAIKIYNWNIKLAVSFFLINSSIFWMIIIFTLDSENQVSKFMLIPLASIVSSLFGIFFSFILNRSFASKAVELSGEDEMLQLLISFSHGEWALRNLNSLQLFFQNFTEEDYFTPKLIEQLGKRVGTFMELTRFNIERIIELSQSANFDIHIIRELKENYSSLYNFINGLHKSDFINFDDFKHVLEAAGSIDRIKKIIAELRYTLFLKSSCAPEKVINRIVEQYDSVVSKTIDIEFVNNLEKSSPVLIKEFELADVIVNLIDNSIEATKGIKQRKVLITLGKLAPKIVIDISDNGKGIGKEKWEEIFNRTYSSKTDGGLGLFVSRRIIRKYGGRIFVKSSNPEIGTTIRIELTEGKKNAADTITS